MDSEKLPDINFKEGDDIVLVYAMDSCKPIDSLTLTHYTVEDIQINPKNYPGKKVVVTFAGTAGDKSNPRLSYKKPCRQYLIGGLGKSGTGWGIRHNIGPRFQWVYDIGSTDGYHVRIIPINSRELITPDQIKKGMLIAWRDVDADETHFNPHIIKRIVRHDSSPDKTKYHLNYHGYLRWSAERGWQMGYHTPYWNWDNDAKEVIVESINGGMII